MRISSVVALMMGVVVFVLTGARVGLADDLPQFTITVQREPTVGDAVPSRVLVDGSDLGPGLEREATKIPAGEYAGALRYVSGKGFAQGPFGAMATTGDFLLEVAEVDGNRTNILFHGGTKPEHSRGCILLGAVQKDASGVKWTGDDTTLRKLRLAFYKTETPNATPAVRIKIIVKDPPPKTSAACDWTESTKCVEIAPQAGKRCGKPASYEIDYTSRCSTNVKIVTCLQRADGKWSCMPDGKFDEGSKPGLKQNAYVCDGTGAYKVFAMPIDKFKAGKCRYPTGADAAAGK